MRSSITEVLHYLSFLPRTTDFYVENFPFFGRFYPAHSRLKPPQGYSPETYVMKYKNDLKKLESLGYPIVTRT